jgi:hypothetical protein
MRQLSRVFVGYVILMILQLNFVQIKAQLLDNALRNYEQKIIDYLKSDKEILDTANNLYSIYQNKIYSRELLHKNNIDFFEVGVTGSHSKKYLLVLKSKKLIIYKSMNFLDDFPSILKNLKVITGNNFKASQIIVLFDSISDIYKYNLNPPWSKSKLLKNPE